MSNIANSNPCYQDAVFAMWKVVIVMNLKYREGDHVCNVAISTLGATHKTPSSGSTEEGLFVIPSKHNYPDELSESKIGRNCRHVCVFIDK